MSTLYRCTTTWAHCTGDLSTSKGSALTPPPPLPPPPLCSDVGALLPHRHHGRECHRYIHEVFLRHLWEIFIRLDMEGDTTLSVDNVVALVLTIFHANGVHRSGAEIGEWFYPHTLVNYISFISALSNGHAKCLKPVIVYHLHEVITTEVLKKGRLTKKGHRVPSWKERFFVLKPSSIDYFMEGEDDGCKEQKVRENCSWCAWELISRYNQSCRHRHII